MKIRTFFGLLFCTYFIGPLCGQEVMTIRHSCNFYGEEAGADKYVFPANAKAKQIVADILLHSGLSTKFELKESNCANALATMDGKQRYILYNPLFLRQFEQDANTKWAAYCVLAHEMAHHLNNHDLEETDPKKRRSFELEADKYAGFLLFHLGASLDAAQLGIQTIKLEGETNTHPPKTARLVAIANGWTQASDLRDGKQPAPNNGTTPSNAPKSNARPDNMVFVKGGMFQMGSNAGDDDEKPVHSVTVSDFYIGRYEVTQAEWRKVMGSDPPELNFKGCDQCPVERVSWNDIQEFLQKLNAQTGKRYRLPTEAEWEYAARGGNQSRGYQYAGSDNLEEVAWHGGNSGSKSHPVGQKKANELGLYDMSGNVWEWCSDWYGTYPSGSQNNPKGAVSGRARVNRGGNWFGGAQFCRVSNRGYDAPTERSNYLGFRLVLQ